MALFDYDPPTMSPNPEACDEELPFREGQLIKIIGEKDADGFYWGECGGRSGYVPCNMVSEVQVDDERVARELLKDDQRMRGRAGWGGRGDRWGDIYAGAVNKKMIALYDYDPMELSPNVDMEVGRHSTGGAACKPSLVMSGGALFPNWRHHHSLRRNGRRRILHG